MLTVLNFLFIFIFFVCLVSENRMYLPLLISKLNKIYFHYRSFICTIQQDRVENQVTCTSLKSSEAKEMFVERI